jgi:hypothetical protein
VETPVRSILPAGLSMVPRKRLAGDRCIRRGARGVSCGVPRHSELSPGPASRKQSGQIGIGGEGGQKIIEGAFVQDDEPNESSWEAQELLRRAWELIENEFEEKTRQAFRGVVHEGRRPKDVAQDLGMKVNAVYLAKSRILRRLREEYGDLLE